MAMTTALMGIVAVAGVGGTAAAGGIAARPAPVAAAAVPTAVLTTATSATGSAPAAACSDGDWRGPGGINVNGRPDSLDAGDRGAVYVWHGADGWHVRTTDAINTAHHYTGTIALSAGSRFTSFSTVRLERDDRVWVDGDNVLHYDFTTYAGIDGLNFTVSACDGAATHETMLFTMDVNGHEDDASRIDLGDAKQHPPFATFTVTRTV